MSILLRILRRHRVLRRFGVLVLALLTATQPVLGYEIDNFRDRSKPLRDAMPALDAQVNSALERAVALANESSRDCSDRTIIEAVHGQLASGMGNMGGFVGTLETFADSDSSIDRIRGPRISDSVYANTPFDSVRSVGWWLERSLPILRSIRRGVVNTWRRVTGTTAISACSVPEDLKAEAEQFSEQIRSAFQNPKKVANAQPANGESNERAQGETKPSKPSVEGNIFTEEPEAPQLSQEESDRIQRVGRYFQCIVEFHGIKENNDSDGSGLQSVVNINGHRVGADKLGHFIEEGFKYFRIAYMDGPDRRGRGVDAALDEGVRWEEGGFGLRATSIKSHGDLAANYRGMLFWHNIFHGNKPYIKCEGGRYKIVRPFSFAEYVDDSWDEGINCSTYVSAEMEQTVSSNLARRGMKCPIDEASCRNLSSRFPAQYVRKILNPRCVSGTSGTGLQREGTVE